MNAADAIAFAALMIGLISIFGVAADVYKRRLAFKERKLELAAKESADQAAHFAAQAQKLRQRRKKTPPVSSCAEAICRVVPSPTVVLSAPLSLSASGGLQWSQSSSF